MRPTTTSARGRGAANGGDGKTGLRVVILNDYGYVNGGAGQVALTSAIALAGRGCSTTAFVAVPPVMPELRVPNLQVVCSEQHEILNDPRRLRAVVQGMWNFKAVRLMHRLLDDLPIDRTIIHVHAWTKALSSGVVRAAIQRNFKVVLTLHDYFVACANGGFYNYRSNQICQLTGQSGRCFLTNCDRKSYPQKLWRVARNAVQSHIGWVPDGIQHFVTVSHLSSKILQPYLPPGARVRPLDYPIDVPKTEPVRVRENSALVAVGRLVPEKGLHLFARAASTLRTQAVFVGDGPRRSEIASMYPAAVFTGWRSRSEVTQLMRTARALVFPSVWYETLGLVVWEAAALGVPAVVADTCAARDLVEDGITGLWFKGGDATDLTCKLRVILEDNDLVEKLGRAAYEQFWSNPPTMHRHVDGLLDIYAAVLASHC